MPVPTARWRGAATLHLPLHLLTAGTSGHNLGLLQLYPARGSTAQFHGTARPSPGWIGPVESSPPSFKQIKTDIPLPTLTGYSYDSITDLIAKGSGVKISQVELQ